MKKYIYLIILALILGLVLTGCSVLNNSGVVPTSEPGTSQEGVVNLSREVTIDPDFSESYPLFAGQDIPVGTVKVWNAEDNSTLYVKYEVETPWRLIETHLHVASELSAIPQTKKSNPIPGQFDYKMEHNYVTDYTYKIPMSLTNNEELYIAAHAVVSDSSQYAGNGVMYAARVGGLYQLDVVQGTNQLLKTITGGFDDVNNGTRYINALAFDPLYYKLYFTAPPRVNVTPSPLWSYDINSGALEKICDLPGSVVGASFYNGAYYYIAEGLNSLMKVEVNSLPYVPTVVCSGFGNASNFTFGDFAISRRGILYGSTRVSPQMFFSLDIASCEYYEFIGSNALDLQLAYGSDGKLYGINHGSGNSYEINIGTGMAIPISFNFVGAADLASGELGVPTTESAWAATGIGQLPFSGKNWATYFEYKLLQPVQLNLLPWGSTAPIETGSGKVMLYNPIGVSNFVVQVDLEGAQIDHTYVVWINAEGADLSPLVKSPTAGSTWYTLGNLFTNGSGDGSFYIGVNLVYPGTLNNIEVALNEVSPYSNRKYSSELGTIVIN